MKMKAAVASSSIMAYERYSLKMSHTFFIFFPCTQPPQDSQMKKMRLNGCTRNHGRSVRLGDVHVKNW